MKSNINKKFGAILVFFAIVMVLPVSVAFAKTKNNTKPRWFGMVPYASANSNPDPSTSAPAQSTPAPVAPAPSPSTSASSPASAAPSQSDPSQQSQPESSDPSDPQPLSVEQLQNAVAPPLQSSTATNSTQNDPATSTGKPVAATIVVTHPFLNPQLSDPQPAKSQAPTVVPSFTNSTLVSALNNISQQYNYSNNSFNPSQTKKMNAVGLGMLVSGAGLYVIADPKNKSKKNSAI